MQNPLPMPSGITKNDLESMKISDGEWRKSFEFLCVHCKEPAYLHPFTNEIWGCKKCGFTTFSVSIHFRANNNPLVADGGRV